MAVFYLIPQNFSYILTLDILLFQQDNNTDKTTMILARIMLVGWIFCLIPSGLEISSVFLFPYIPAPYKADVTTVILTMAKLSSMIFCNITPSQFLGGSGSKIKRMFLCKICRNEENTPT